MSIHEERRLRADHVIMRCGESEVQPVAGESAGDVKLFLGLGQDRLEQAIEFCVATDDECHNVAAVDLSGSGAFAIIEGLIRKSLKARRARLPDPKEVCYYYNFEDQTRPQPHMFDKKGSARKFQRRLARILIELQTGIPLDLFSDHAKSRKKEVRQESDQWLMTAIQEFSKARGFDASGEVERVLFTPLMTVIRRIRGEAPAADTESDALVDATTLSSLTEAQKGELTNVQSVFNAEFNKWLQELKATSEGWKHLKETSVKIENVEREIVKGVVTQVFDKWWEQGGPQGFREKLQDYAVGNYKMFLKDEDEKKSPFSAPEDPFLPWRVNVFVDHSDTEGVPIVACPIDKLSKAIGNISVRSMGAFGFAVDHRNMSPGLFHLAGGGYLVVNSRDLMTIPGLWQCLKSVIKTGEITVGETPFTPPGMGVLHPEPMPAKFKVVLFGPAWLIHLLGMVDDEFAKLFKIRGELLTKVKYTPAQVRAYRAYFDEFTGAKGMHSLKPDAVCTLIEQAVRMAGDHKHLSTDFANILPLIVEANALIPHDAEGEDEEMIGRAHIEEARRRLIWRSSVVHERRLEFLESKSLLISTSGKVVGQINGLVVTGCESVEQQIAAFCRLKELPFTVPPEIVSELQSQYGGVFASPSASPSFGFATRITARASVGKFAVLNIHKEADLVGPSFDKAAMTVQGLIEAMYGNDAALFARLTYAFEQTYGPIDGDSASVAKFLALTSAIGDIPLLQDKAFTGSLNLQMEIQPIGGVNEKTEGWYDVCCAKGDLTGEQGVVIPHQNVQNLMLRKDVAEAVANGLFKVWAMHTLDEALELAAGIPAAEYHRNVVQGFKARAEKAKEFNALMKSD